MIVSTWMHRWLLEKNIASDCWKKEELKESFEDTARHPLFVSPARNTLDPTKQVRSHLEDVSKHFSLNYYNIIHSFAPRLIPTTRWCAFCRLIRALSFPVADCHVWAVDCTNTHLDSGATITNRIIRQRSCRLILQVYISNTLPAALE